MVTCKSTCILYKAFFGVGERMQQDIFWHLSGSDMSIMIARENCHLHGTSLHLTETSQ